MNDIWISVLAVFVFGYVMTEIGPHLHEGDSNFWYYAGNVVSGIGFIMAMASSCICVGFLFRIGWELYEH